MKTKKLTTTTTITTTSIISNASNASKNNNIKTFATSSKRTKKIDTEWTCQQCKYTQEGMDMKGCEHCADPHKVCPPN